MLTAFLWLASGLHATTYNWGEMNCGDVNSPKICEHGAVTASGERLDNNIPQAAIAIPKKYRIKPQWVCLRVGNKQAMIRIVDKMNERYVGMRGFDLTPAALTALGIKPHRNWSDKVYVCK